MTHTRNLNIVLMVFYKYNFRSIHCSLPNARMVRTFFNTVLSASCRNFEYLLFNTAPQASSN